MTWVYLHGDRIVASNPNDMTGNTGWAFVQNDTPIQGAELTNADGVALFKLVSGEILPRTAEEIEADTPEPTPDPEVLTDTDMAEILADHEYRICLMELDVSEEELV